MFKGFIKAIGIFAVIYLLFIYLILNDHTASALLFFYGALIAIVPVALHGTYRYRMSKTSWKGIRFGYNGYRGELLGIFVKGLILTILTLGIYGAWFTINVRRYLLSNVNVGNARFEYTGDGNGYFRMNLRGYLLTLLTLGIYLFWWKKDQFEFFVNNLRLEQENDVVFFTSKATGQGFAGLMIINLLMLVFTLGLAYPWIMIRTMSFVTNNIEASGYYSFDSLLESQEDYSNATAEDMADILDVGII